MYTKYSVCTAKSRNQNVCNYNQALSFFGFIPEVTIILSNDVILKYDQVTSCLGNAGQNNSERRLLTRYAVEQAWFNPKACPNIISADIINAAWL